jgi:hypothetical protein
MLLYNFSDINMIHSAIDMNLPYKGAGTELPGTLKWNSVPEGDIKKIWKICDSAFGRL